MEEFGHIPVHRRCVNPSVSGGGGGPYTNYSSYLTNGTYPPDASGGQAGETQEQAGTTFYYIRRASDDNITQELRPGQQIMIEVYSDKLRNLALRTVSSSTNP